jgi:hypothetical protein
MKRALITAWLLLGLPAAAWAGDSCPGCVIGVYDDSSHTGNAGYWNTSESVFKEI